MSVRFVGGPLDGREFEPGQIAAVADVTPLPGGSGARAFITMPAPAACDRVLQGQSPGGRGNMATYEQVFLPDGGFEFRHVTDDEFREAMRSGPSAGEGGEFGEIADRLGARVRDGAIGAGTEVYLVYRYADREGNEFALRGSVVPWGRARAGEAASMYEADVNRDAIIGTVQALVRSAPTGWITLPTHPDRKVRIAGFDLDIVPSG